MRFHLMTLLGTTALVVAACAPPVESDAVPAAPPFSRRIATAFPGAPFITCELGQFEDSPADGPSAPQHWYVRPASAGEIRVDLHALPSGPDEGGAIGARLYDARGALLAEASVPYLPGRTNVASLRAAVSRASIYRLEVRRTAGASGRQGRHYRLGVSGVPVEVGMNGPALPRWLEGRNLAPQVFHVHVDSGERLRLFLTAGEGQPIPSLTLELREESGALLKTATWATRDPFEVVLELARARTLRIVTFGNHHFSLDKRSGSDRGIYFDTCPPNTPPR